MKVVLEYVWLDGYKPEPNLRSKVKIVEYESIKTLKIEDFLYGILMGHQLIKQRQVSPIVY